MTESALMVRSEMSLQDTMTLGKTLADSGFFSDTGQAAQAVVKILAGREMGFGPIASMTGISVIQGKVAIGANLMAAAIKRDPRYDYRVIEMTSERCDLLFFENGAEVGHSTFTIEEARAAGVGSAKPPGKPNSMLNMFPRNLLFARALSNGMRWYCPDATGGPSVYTPEELGANVDADGTAITVPSRTVSGGDARKATAELFEDYDPDLAEAQRELHDLEEPAPHWITNPKVRARFWAWTGDTLGLDGEQVHTALGVEHVEEFAGTMDEAKTAILNWNAARKESEVVA